MLTNSYYLNAISNDTIKTFSEFLLETIYL